MAPFIFAFLFVALGFVGLIVATIKLRRQTGPASSTFGTLSLPASRAVQSHPRNVPAHPRNAPGPFYVLYDCCTACGVPEAMAPDHFAYDAGRNCFVKRQPESPDELEKMLRVIRRQELGCIRYRGTDKQVLRRLAEAGESRHCDAAPPRGAEPVLRNHVSFAAMEPVARSWRGAHVLEDFADYLRRRAFAYQMTPIVQDGAEAHFSISWFEDTFHRVMIRSIKPGTGQWLVRHSYELGLSEAIDDWLKASRRFGDVRWYSEVEWEARRAGQERPW